MSAIDLTRIRAETLGAANGAYLHNAGAALMPAPVLEAQKTHLDLEAAIGGYAAATREAARLDAAYSTVARLINAKVEEIALVENATIAWQMAFYGLATTFRAGDRILTAQAEYAANYVAFLVYRLRPRRGRCRRLAGDRGKAGLMIGDILHIAAILGSGLVAGAFFAISSFVMPALRRRPAAEAAATMQAINVTVISWHFLGAFFGTALLALVLPWFGNAWAIAGSLLYLSGTIGITIGANVPRNERLAKNSPTDAGTYWLEFAQGWTYWNHLRAHAAAGAVVAYGLSLGLPA